MTRMVRDVMTPNPLTVNSSVSIAEVAQQMRDGDVGAIIVQNDGAIAVTVRADPANAQKARARFGRPQAHAH